MNLFGFDFWAAQQSAERWTKIYVVLFAIGISGTAVLTEFLFRSLTGITGGVPTIGIIFAGIALMVSGRQYLGIRSQGGAFVAQQQGGHRVDENSQDLSLRQYHNIVHEMAVAAGVPVPEAYVIPSPAINAFAAGLSDDRAAVAVTTGALQVLSRSELQGVVAHEIGHIRNHDMVLNVRLGVLVAGFFAVIFWGMQVLRIPRALHSGRGGGNVVGLLGLLLTAAGSLSWLVGSLLKAAVSRQREYYADARAVQFTRRTDGIRSALVKILNEPQKAMPAEGAAYSHLYLDNRLMLGGLFSTHPPLKERIGRLSNYSEIESELNVLD